jgi:16S rRNA (cytosine967-C5)-methyltransferase
VSRSGSQQRTLVGILARLRPHWRTDAGLPSRIDALLRSDRRLGSRDRKLYRELLYTALRYLPWIEPLLDSDSPEAVRRIAWLTPESPAVHPFRGDTISGSPECPPGADEKAQILGADADALSPGWCREECPEVFSSPLRESLLTRAPLWLRLQAEDPAEVFREFDALGWPWRRSTLVPGALELPAGADVSKTAAYASGSVEVQDIGSQLILESVEVPRGGHWLDACAGSGGKTLQLAALLGPGGRVTARDVRPAALEELSVRAVRAGLLGRIAVGEASDPSGGFDGVLVDAPCSGSGTWRRSPHLKWVTTHSGVRASSSLQLRLLRENAPRVREGGYLVYATCSLCRSENEAVAGAFLAETPGFKAAGAAKRLLPQAHDGDGFFVAPFRRTATDPAISPSSSTPRAGP